MIYIVVLISVVQQRDSVLYINNLRYEDDRKKRGTKEPLDEGERGDWKSWLKTQHSKNEDHGI